MARIVIDRTFTDTDVKDAVNIMFPEMYLAIVQSVEDVIVLDRTFTDTDIKNALNVMFDYLYAQASLSTVIYIDHTFTDTDVKAAINIMTLELYDYIWTVLNYSDEAKAYFDRLEEVGSLPASSQLKNIDDLIKGLVADGLWDNGDVLSISALPLEGQALLNVIKNDHNATKTGTLIFTPNKGFKGNNSGYLKRNFIPKTQGVNYQKDSATIATFITEGIEDTGYDVGAGDNSTTNRTLIGGAYFRMHVSSPFPTTGDPEKYRYVRSEIIVRSASNLVTQYVNAISKTTYADLSTDMPSVQYYEFANNIGNVLFSPSSRQMSATYYGGKITSDQVIKLHLHITNYLIKTSVIIKTIGIIGDSTIAYYTAYRAVKCYLNENFGYMSYDISTIGHKINDQKTKWLALDNQLKTHPSTLFIQIGINDIVTADSSATIIANYQSMLNTVKSTLNSTCKVVIATMTPIRGRLDVLFGAGADAYYTKWLELNESIKGLGATPITGSDSIIFAHTDLLSDGNGYLLPTYDSGDHIHENDAGREVIAIEWLKVI